DDGPRSDAQQPPPQGSPVAEAGSGRGAAPADPGGAAPVPALDRAGRSWRPVRRVLRSGSDAPLESRLLAAPVRGRDLSGIDPPRLRTGRPVPVGHRPARHRPGHRHRHPVRHRPRPGPGRARFRPGAGTLGPPLRPGSADRTDRPCLRRPRPAPPGGRCGPAQPGLAAHPGSPGLPARGLPAPALAGCRRTAGQRRHGPAGQRVAAAALRFRHGFDSSHRAADHDLPARGDEPMTARLSILASALLLAACGQSGSPDTQAGADAGDQAAAGGDRVVYVYNWSDYIAEDTLANFEQETGIRVVYDTYDSNEMMEAKLLAGASGYDVVFPSARPFAERHIQAGVYLPLDKAQLPNLANLDPGIVASLQDVDPGNAYTVPYFWGTTGLGINIGKVTEALGEDAALDSWSLLFDPATVGKLANCGVSVLDDEQEAFAAALIWKGMDPNGHDRGESQVVAEVYKAIKPHLRYCNSGRYMDDLANGGLCLAMGYSGDIAMAADRSEEAGTGFEIQYVIPKEGAVRWVDLIAIPKDAPHP